MAIIRVTRVADIDSRNKLIGTDVRYIWFVILQSRSVAFFSYSTLRWFFLDTNHIEVSGSSI